MKKSFPTLLAAVIAVVLTAPAAWYTGHARAVQESRDQRSSIPAQNMYQDAIGNLAVQANKTYFDDASRAQSYVNAIDDLAAKCGPQNVDCLIVAANAAFRLEGVLEELQRVKEGEKVIPSGKTSDTSI